MKDIPSLNLKEDEGGAAEQQWRIVQIERKVWGR